MYEQIEKLELRICCELLGTELNVITGMLIFWNVAQQLPWCQMTNMLFSQWWNHIFFLKSEKRHIPPIPMTPHIQLVVLKVSYVNNQKAEPDNVDHLNWSV